MSKMSIKLKLTLLAALFAVGLGAFVALIFATTADKVEQSDYAEVIELMTLQADILPPPMFVVEAMQTAQLMPLVREDKAKFEALVQQWQGFERDLTARRGYWDKGLTDTVLRAPLNETLDKGRRFFEVGNTAYIPAVRTGNAAQITSANADLLKAFEDQKEAVHRLVEQTNQETARSIASASTAIAHRKQLSALLGLALALVAGGIGLYIARDVAKRMAETVQVLTQVADGDMTARLAAESGDEIGAMANALNSAFESVDEVLSRVQAVANQVAGSAGTLSSSAEEISSGAQQQASSLEETAASLEQITATVRQSAGNAQQASQLAEQSRDVATQGGSVVQEAVSAMDEVTRSSRRIGDIITTIDEIALQTNLLALNAAVEAARAGEQGRGFAVVAAEVGSLAQRSAAAAKEVKSLIEDTLERVEVGHSLVGRSGKALSEIITSVKRVTDIVGEIASASREQSAGVEQVNQAVTQMDQVTQSNAAQTDALSQTAGSLAGAAGELQTLVGRFQLTAGSEGSSAPEPGAGGARRRAVEGAARRGGPRPPRLPARGPRPRVNARPAAESSEDEVELV
jgi:methyl-accepting chemotaxis protein